MDARQALQAIVDALDARRVEIIIHQAPPGSSVVHIAGISIGTELVLARPRGYIATAGLSRLTLLRLREQINELLGEVSS